MRPDTRRRAPEDALLDRSDHQNGCRHRSPVLAYLEGRERVLGRHRPIHVTDAAIAADELAAALGGVARARRFALEILDELEQLRRWAS